MRSLHPRSRAVRRTATAVVVAGASLAAAGVPGAASAESGEPAAAPAGSSCPTTVDPAQFASSAELRRLVEKENSYGLRWPGSASQERQLAWMEREARRIDDVRIESQRYSIARMWTPTPRARKGPSRDLVAAGGLTTFNGRSGTNVPVASAIPFTLPTSRSGGARGELVYLKADEPITAENAAGKVVIRDFEQGSIPYSAFEALGLYISPDSATRTGDFMRPYLSPSLHPDLLAASSAGAAGVVFAFDIPTAQVRGYFDPHDGTRYRVPGVYVGSEEAARLKRLAAQNRFARITVRAEVKRVRTRNLIATIPGESEQKMVLAVNHDGFGAVQDNGVVGLLALGRYYGSLPKACRARTLVLAFGASHSSLIRGHEGTDRYAEGIDREYDQGKVSFAFPVEHLGTRELEPVGEGSRRRLRFTGKPEPWLWAVGPSTAMRDTIVGIAQRRNLRGVAVLRGASAPTQTVPTICSFGGLGNAFHTRLIPTTAVISGPWSLYGPSFGLRALDFGHMRQQLLAIGDTILALDGVPQADIAGDYTNLREQRAQGAATCPRENRPSVAPGPDA